MVTSMLLIRRDAWAEATASGGYASEMRPELDRSPSACLIRPPSGLDSRHVPKDELESTDALIRQHDQNWICLFYYRVPRTHKYLPLTLIA